MNSNIDVAKARPYGSISLYTEKKMHKALFALRDKTPIFPYPKQ